jgi:hypothetical protein
MSRTFHAVVRGGLAAALLAAGTFVACSRPARQPVGPGLGTSTVPVPGSAAAPLVDAPGVPPPSAPTPAATPPTGAWREGTSQRVAEVEADELQARAPTLDAGLRPAPSVDGGLPQPTNPPNAPRPTNPGNGSGVGGNPVPPTTGPATPPRAPSPTKPPSTPTPAPR